MKKRPMISIALFIIIMVIATAISTLLDFYGVHESNLIMIYILAVIIIAIFSNHYAYNIVSPFVVVILFNFFFTEPRLTLSTYDPQYPLTFLIMITISMIASTLTLRLKTQTEISERILKEKQAVEIKAHSENLRSNILKSISHDLRTPLTSINGCLETLIETKNLDKATRIQLLKDAQDDTNWMIRLIENILNISKIQDNRLFLKRQEETLDDIVSEAMKRINKMKEHRTIKVTLPKDVVTVDVDIHLITQVFINLLENAINHTEIDGTINVRIDNTSEYVLFAIEDDGPGIKALDQPHIFELFYTAKNDGARGIGLGLSICKAIVEAHKGKIDVEKSTLGGARFKFMLPIGGVYKNE